MPIRPFILAAALASSLVALSGCDQLGIESASVTAARLEADGKAVGAACRHGGRAIEDCFTLNKRVDKAAIYAGWRDMDDYMRENKIEAVVPTLAPDGKAKGTTTADAGDGSISEAPAAKSEKPADRTADKGADKPARGDRLAKADKAGKPDTADTTDKTAAADADKAVSAH